MNQCFAFIFLSLVIQVIADGAPESNATETSPDEGNESGHYGWCTWGQWSACSKTCGPGTQTRYKHGPPHKHCEQIQEHKQCNLGECGQYCNRDEDCKGDGHDCSGRYFCRHHRCKLEYPACLDSCLQQFACPGPCHHYIPSWSYNQATGRCERFKYGGCMGNENRFSSYRECSQRCAKPDQCAPMEFKCVRPCGFKCIEIWRTCDGKEDCGDGSDEYPKNPNCQNPDPCGHGKFKCGDGQCIPKWLTCDGKYDCRDRSDEYPYNHECHVPTPPPHPEPDHRCHCINPFNDPENRPFGDPAWMCRTQNQCYVKCDNSCSDEKASAHLGRCTSEYACVKPGKEKKEKKNDLKYLDYGKK